jgi:hypothetical protein
LSEADLVRVNVSIANAVSPSVANLNTGLVAAFHTHYADRVRVYSTASALTAMVTDGFSVNEPAYKAVQAYASAPNTPANVCIGRRANPYTQTLWLNCVDGTVGDAYAFTLVGTDGTKHALSYTNVIAPGSALAGTVTTTAGSPTVTFTSSQSLTKGGVLIFSGTGGQPGVYYAVAATAASTTQTLSGNYQGIGGAGETATYIAPLAGTFNFVNGSPIVVTSTTQVGVILPGDSVQCMAQLGTYYTVLSVSATQVVLTQPYSGVTVTPLTNNYAVDVCSATTAALALAIAINAITPANKLGVATAQGQVIILVQTPGALTDVQGWLANGFAAIQLTDATADPGIVADLVAMEAANTGAFYAFVLDSNSAAEIESVAQHVEATGNGGKVFFWNNSDYNNVVVGDASGDVFTSLKASAYVRNVGSQNNSELLCYAGAATCGNSLARNPGSYTLGFMNLPGVPADSVTSLTEGQLQALNTMSAGNPGSGGKNGNWYQTTGGINILFPGTAPSGRFFDLTILVDWLTVTIQQAIFGVLTGMAATGKVPYTDFGLGLIADAVDGVLRLGATPAYGGILPDGQDPKRPIKVTATPVANISPTDRANRNIPSGAISWSAGIAGAAETVTVAGTLTP